MKAIFDAEPWSLNDRPHEPSFKITAPMARDIAEVVVSIQMADHIPLANQNIDIGYCIDAFDLIPMPITKTLRIPTERSCSVEVHQPHYMRGR